MGLTSLQNDLMEQIAEKQPVSSARLGFVCDTAIVALDRMGLIGHSAASGFFGVLWSLTEAGAQYLGQTAMPVDCAYCRRTLRYKPGGGKTDATSSICEDCGNTHYPGIASRIYSGIEQSQL